MAGRLHLQTCPPPLHLQYVLTGDAVYLDAVLGAWEMLRDPAQGWIHVGGSFAINEGDYYSPGSFHIDYGTHAMGSSSTDTDAVLVARRGGRKRDWFRAERGRLAGEPGWLSHDHDAHALAHELGDAAAYEHHHGVGDEWNGQFPTGEFCGYALHVGGTRPAVASAHSAASSCALPQRDVLAQAQPEVPPAVAR